MKSYCSFFLPFLCPPLGQETNVEEGFALKTADQRESRSAPGAVFSAPSSFLLFSQPFFFFSPALVVLNNLPVSSLPFYSIWRSTFNAIPSPSLFHPIFSRVDAKSGGSGSGRVESSLVCVQLFSMSEMPHSGQKREGERIHRVALEGNQESSMHGVSNRTGEYTGGTTFRYVISTGCLSFFPFSRDIVIVFCPYIFALWGFRRPVSPRPTQLYSIPPAAMKS